TTGRDSRPRRSGMSKQEAEENRFTQAAADLIFGSAIDDEIEWADGHPVKRSAAGEPERRLLLAMLEDALLDVQKHYGSRGRKSHQLYEDAWQWFESESEWMFSFRNICEV